MRYWWLQVPYHLQFVRLPAYPLRCRMIAGYLPKAAGTQKQPISLVRSHLIDFVPRSYQFPFQKKRTHKTVRPLHSCPKMGITKGHKQNIVCGLNSQSFIVDPLKGYKNQRQPISASVSPFIDQLSEKAPHNVSWYKLVWSRNQCQLFRTTSCSPLSDNVFLIIIILAPFVKSEKLIYLFWFLLKWSLQSSYYLISLVLKCMVDSVADFVKIKPFVIGQFVQDRLAYFGR